MKKVNKIEDIDPRIAIQNNLWKIFDLLRSEPISSDEYFVVLFFMSLYKDGYIDEISDKENLKEALEEKILNRTEDYYKNDDFNISLLTSNYGKSYNFYKKIYDVYKPIISKIGNSSLLDIFNIFKGIEKYNFCFHFNEFFEDILQRIIKSQGRVGVGVGVGFEFIMPSGLIDVINNIANLSENDTVFNPFSGLATFAKIQRPYGSSVNPGYYGQEINYKTWALGTLRLLATQNIENIRYLNCDSLSNWPSDKENFDLIVSNPPFGERLSDEQKQFYPDFVNLEHFLIKKGVDSLSDKGKLIAVLSHGFLFRDGKEKELRKQLIASDLIETIISLPAGLFLNTNIPTVILVINKNKSSKGIIRFINAEKMVNKYSRNENKLNVHYLNSFIDSNTDSDELKIISLETIKENDFNLNVSRYFLKDFDGVVLSEVCHIIRLKGITANQKGKFVKIRNLKNDKFDTHLDIVNIEEVDLPKYVRKIDESCLLVALRWETLKPTFFKYKNTPVYISNDILALKVDNNKVDINYLINELYSEYVKEQLTSIRYGNPIPSIKSDDLLNIKIKVLSPEGQKAKIEGIKEEMVRTKFAEAERNALAHNMDHIINENFASIKHSLGKPLMNIGSSLRNVEKAMFMINKDWETFKLSERLDVNLKDTFNAIYTNLEHIHSILKNNESELDLSNYKLENLKILEFVIDYVNNIKTSQKNNIEISLEIPENISNTLYYEMDVIPSNKELLEIIFNNIVENANRHAFIDPNKKYKLSFIIDTYSENLVERVDGESKIGDKSKEYIKISIANNGERFPENFTLEKLIRKNSFAGSTGNTGIGGYDINRIIKYHGGRFDLRTDDKTSEFTTIYEILLPAYISTIVAQL